MPSSAPTFAILVAAGAGTRMGADIPKALAALAGRPLLLWSLAVLSGHPRVDGVIVVAPPGREERVRALLPATGRARLDVVAGGASRSESVREGLCAVPGSATTVLVHDAARPLVDAALVDAVLDGLDGVDGAIAAAPVVDTIKRARDDGTIDATVARAGLWAAQTPQAFRAPAFRAAVEAAFEAGRLAPATDCAAIVEAWGGRVRLIASKRPNPKITTAADLAAVEALLARVRPG